MISEQALKSPPPFSKAPGEQPRFSFRARLKSFVYAGRGLRWLVQDEHNAWLHVAASVLAVGAGLLLNISYAEWRWVVLAMAIVWIAEAFNTAVEELCDHVSPEFNESIGRTKDLAAGGVLVASIMSAIIGLLTLLPPLLALLA